MVSPTTEVSKDRSSQQAALEREPRRAVVLPGYAALEDGSTFSISILDLSYDGCKIETPVALLPQVKLKLAVLKLGSLDAEVRWYSNGCAGIRFSTENCSQKEKSPRQHDRTTVAAELSLRQSGQQNYFSNVFDLTPSGCKVEFVQRPREGDVIWAKFHGLDALEATVRWVDGFVGGIEFKRPIYPAVFELLLAKLKG
jgi:PilZ domain-containing protein